MYKLLDFGDGRKLERFAEYTLDRPAPAAKGERQNPRAWSADAVFVDGERDRGKWNFQRPFPKDLAYEDWFGQLILAPSPFGHLGIFPEHLELWSWLRDRATVTGEPLGNALSGLQILNLFAYTGGATLALARLGARVVHVDSAANTVRRARDNALKSGLKESPIRWIVEDAMRFCQRELRRRRSYDGFVVDPPSYGHGPGRDVWKIDRDLPSLLTVLDELTASPGRLMVFTCHTPGYDDRRLKSLIGNYIPSFSSSLEGGSLHLSESGGRRLPSGHYVRSYSQ